MRTESDLILAIQRAGSLAEQASLVAELDALKASKAAAHSLDGEVDLGSAIVTAALTPVRVHEHHTAATDWLDDVSMTTEADLRTATNTMAAEASLWFARISDDVKADREEFGEQARGMARRLAGKYDEMAPAAAQAFLDYADFLHRRTAASGLDQVQQITAPDGTTQRRTELPQDTFDTFNPPVADVNEGIDEMQTTENAPLLNEIIQNGQGQGQPEKPGGHSDTQEFSGPMQNGAGEPIQQHIGSLVDAPSVALGYTMNLDDFRRMASNSQDDCIVPGCDNKQADERGEDANDSGMCNLHARQQSNKDRLQNKSSLGSRHPFGKQAQVGDDGTGWRDSGGDHFQNQIKDTYEQHGLQEEEWGNHHDGEENVTDTQSPANFQNLTRQPGSKSDYPASHHASRTVVSRVVVEGASGLPQVEQLVDSQENPAPTPLPTDVMFPLIEPTQWSTDGTGDARAEGQPVDPSAQGDGPKRMGSKTAAPNAGSDNPHLGETANGSPGSAEPPSNAMQKAVQNGGGGGAPSRHSDTSATTPKEPVGGMGGSPAATPNSGVSHHQQSPHLTHATRKTASEGSPEFRKGFAFAANWKPEMPLVKKGSAEFEAGLFAGMRENGQEAQEAWINRHESRGGAFARRIALARKFAGTSTDLDTMDAGTQPAPNGNTPINGPGTPPPLEGGMDAAAPGGASPYNGAAPFGQPVAPDPLLPIGIPQPGNPAVAFRQRIQAGLLREMQEAQS